MADSFDIIIIGGGIAGVSAALTCVSRGKTVGVIANPYETSNLYKAEKVTNYPGIKEISGPEFAALLHEQLLECGAEEIRGRALSVLPFGERFGVAVGTAFYEAGAVILAAGGQGPKITHVTTGMIVDAGIKDANSMGSAMAPAAYETLKAHFTETGRSPNYYDAIFTGDLGAQGHDILQALFRADGVELDARYMDCGVLMFDLNTQNVGCGGSGCGCCASVLGGHILEAMNKGVWQRVLVAATGALMSPTSAQQGDSIPGICHAVAIESGV